MFVRLVSLSIVLRPYVPGRHGVNSIPELELMVNSNSNSGIAIAIDYLKTELEVVLELIIGTGIEVSYKN